MGQGAEDAGGYEIDYDPAYEGLYNHNPPKWKNEIPVDEMSDQHLRNALRFCKNVAPSSTFSCDEDKWHEWIEVLEMELDIRRQQGISIKDKNSFRAGGVKKGTGRKGKSTAKKRISMYESIEFTSSTVQMKCHCGETYTAKVADLKRGWGVSCSKRCAAIRREFGRPAGILIE